jgi:hypothetical protein
LMWLVSILSIIYLLLTIKVIKPINIARDFRNFYEVKSYFTNANEVITWRP